MALGDTNIDSSNVHNRSTFQPQTDLNGRKPPIAMWTTTLRYHGDGGISLAIFLVRHGASKPEAMFFPRIPPKTLRGKPTNNQTNMMRNIVVNGNACTASNVIRDENYRGSRIYT